MLPGIFLRALWDGSLIEINVLINKLRSMKEEEIQIA
jgi:hypothetical protein